MKSALQFSMLVLGAALAAPAIPASHAEAATGTIRCTSQDNGYTACPIYEQGIVRLARKLSDAACNEGQSWGFDAARNMIWVDRGCRADFTVDTSYGATGNVYGQGPNTPAADFRTLANGEIEARMSRNCVITYDTSGYRARSSNGCRDNDIRRGDQQISAYRSQSGNPAYGQYGGQYGQYGQYGTAPSNMRFLPNGDTEIVMSNNCVVTYNPGGYRIRNNGCSGSDITRADQQLAAFRAQPPYPNANGQYGQNGALTGNTRQLPNGDTEILLPGNCVAAYNPGGYRVRSNGCSDNDLRRTDQQYATYRSRYNNAGYPNPQGPLPANMRAFQNGAIEITMTPRCTVAYDATGYRVRTDPGCTGDNITIADREYAGYRRR